MSPRLGVAFDLFGNGRTALKASVARYVNGVGLAAASITDNANPRDDGRAHRHARRGAISTATARPSRRPAASSWAS